MVTKKCNFLTIQAYDWVLVDVTLSAPIDIKFLYFIHISIRDDNFKGNNEAKKFVLAAVF
jgi:hypothetical protein